MSHHKRPRRGRARAGRTSLPPIEADDGPGASIDQGDQRMFVVGFTAGGAPYGLVDWIQLEPPRDDEPF